MNWFDRLQKRATGEPVMMGDPSVGQPSPSPAPVSTPAVPPMAAPTPAPTAVGGSVGVEVKQNNYGSSFLVLKNAYPLVQALKQENMALGRGGLNFTYFGATREWSKKLELLTPQDIEKLESLGVNLSVLKQPEYAQMIGVRVQNADPNAPKTPAEQKIQEFRLAVEKAMGGAEGGSAKVKAMTEHVDKYLEQLAASADDAAQQDFVKAFLVFSGKFWQYSLHNQLLIYMQKPTATYCRGPRQWEKMGRRVVNPQNGISILSPRFPKEKGQVQEQSPEDGTEPDREKMRLTGKTPGRPMFFVPVEIFDISDTQAIEGWKDKETGAGPFEGADKWRVDPNEPDEKLEPLVHAALNFAQSLGIDMNLEGVMPDQMGGYSAGGKVVVNKGHQGINQFSTIIHELAHEYLHQNMNGDVSSEEIKSLVAFLEEKGHGGERIGAWLQANAPFKGERDMLQRLGGFFGREVVKAAIFWMKQKYEIEAESTAFIVLQHFGVETKDSPNYLALWKANSAQVKSRRDNIVKAVQALIRGIEAELPESPQGAPAQPQPMQPMAASNWYRRVKAGMDTVAVTTSTNFSNWFNSSVGNGWGSLEEDEKPKKKKKPTGHPSFDVDDHDFED